MPTPKHVLFICTGNTCRSPLAEGLFRKLVAGRDDFEVGSAGIAASAGTPCNPESALLLAKRGAELENFRSRRVTAALLDRATHVFAMTRGHLQALEDQFPQHSDKFYLTCEFADIPGLGLGADLPDPIGMGRAAYEETAAALDLALPAILEYIARTWRPGNGSDHA